MNTVWDRRFMQIAQLVSEWSKDPEKKVGCVIVNRHERIISCGFNGYPNKLDDINLENRLSKVVHAEVNAILNAKVDLSGSTLYVYPLLPCSSCAGIIAQAGITRVVVYDKTDLPKWRTDITKEIFLELGIELGVANV